MSDDKSKLEKVKEFLDEYGSGALTEFTDGVQMDDECPQCGKDGWDLSYHGPGQAGFSCINCGCMKHSDVEGTRYVYDGATIKFDSQLDDDD